MHYMFSCLLLVFSFVKYRNRTSALRGKLCTYCCFSLAVACLSAPCPDNILGILGQLILGPGPQSHCARSLSTRRPWSSRNPWTFCKLLQHCSDNDDFHRVWFSAPTLFYLMSCFDVGKFRIALGERAQKGAVRQIGRSYFRASEMIDVLEVKIVSTVVEHVYHLVSQDTLDETFVLGCVLANDYL